MICVYGFWTQNFLVFGKKIYLTYGNEFCASYPEVVETYIFLKPEVKLKS